MFHFASAGERLIKLRSQRIRIFRHHTVFLRIYEASLQPWRWLARAREIASPYEVC